MEKLGIRFSKLVIIAVVAGVSVLSAWLIGLNFGIMAALAAVVLCGAVAVQMARERLSDETGAGPLSFAFSVALMTALVFVLIQFIPAGRDHINPPITGEPAWADPQARQLMVRACYGCHSNEVEWPAYSNIAPLSWAISNHVSEGREAVNYSEFDQPQEEADETIEVILEGSMPPAYYTRFGLHSEAVLSDQERAALVASLRRTPGFGESEDRDGDEDRREDD